MSNKKFAPTTSKNSINKTSGYLREAADPDAPEDAAQIDISPEDAARILRPSAAELARSYNTNPENETDIHELRTEKTKMTGSFNPIRNQNPSQFENGVETFYETPQKAKEKPVSEFAKGKETFFDESIKAENTAPGQKEKDGIKLSTVTIEHIDYDEAPLPHLDDMDTSAKLNLEDNPFAEYENSLSQQFGETDNIPLLTEIEEGVYEIAEKPNKDHGSNDLDM